MYLKCALCSYVIWENRSIRSGLGIGRYSMLMDQDRGKKILIGTSIFLRLPPQQTLMTFWPQLLAATSTMEALNMARFHVLNLPWDAQEILPEVRVEDLMDRGLSQTFPLHPN